MVFPIGDTFPKYRMPVGVLALIAVNVAVMVHTWGMSPHQQRALFSSVGLIPWEILNGQDIGGLSPHPLWLTVFTSMFVHGGFWHLAGNMLFLWAFGNTLEQWLGTARFLMFYLLTGALAAALHIAMHPASMLPTVGASGAIAGVLGGYFVRFPFARIRTLVGFPPFLFVIGIPALLCLGMWFLLQLQGGLATIGPGELSNIAFWAHIGGFGAGMLLVGLFTPAARQRMV